MNLNLHLSCCNCWLSVGNFLFLELMEYQHTLLRQWQWPSGVVVEIKIHEGIFVDKSRKRIPFPSPWALLQLILQRASLERTKSRNKAKAEIQEDRNEISVNPALQNECLWGENSSGPTQGAGRGCSEEEEEEEDVPQLLDLLGCAPFCLQEMLTSQTEMLHGLHCQRVLKTTCRICIQAERLNETKIHSSPVVRLFLDKGAAWLLQRH